MRPTQHDVAIYVRKAEDESKKADDETMNLDCLFFERMKACLLASVYWEVAYELSMARGAAQFRYNNKSKHYRQLYDDLAHSLMQEQTTKK